MPLILGTNSIKDTGYDVANSLRFDDGDSAYLEKNFSTTQDSRRKFTFSAWVKRGNLTTSTNIWGSSEGSGEGYNSLKFENHKLQYLSGNTSNSGTQVNLETNRLFRDVSAWYHIVLAVDTSQGTDSNRIKFYVNGSQETSFNTSTYPSQDTDLLTSTTPQMTIGMRDLRGTNAQFWDGYMCEVVFIDNQQLAPDQFGEFDSNSPTIWKPKDVSGLTFGTNGFYQEYKQSGTSANSSGLGADTSGNDHHFTVNNLTAVDQSTDTCTLNMTTANPLHFNATIPSAGTLSDGNLTFTSSQGASSYPAFYSTMAVSQGKWYAEFKVTTAQSGMIGIGDGIPSGGFLGGSAYDYALFHSGELYNNGLGESTGYNSYSDNDIIGVALDLDNNKVYFHKDNTYMASGNPAGNSGGKSITASASTTAGVYHFAYGDAGGTTSTISANFGSPAYAISSGNTDGNGYGNFEYAVPSGYYALNSKNLAEFG